MGANLLAGYVSNLNIWDRKSLKYFVAMWEFSTLLYNKKQKRIHLFFKACVRKQVI